MTCDRHAKYVIQPLHQLFPVIHLASLDHLDDLVLKQMGGAPFALAAGKLAVGHRDGGAHRVGDHLSLAQLVAGTAPELPAILESRIQNASNKTLGHLIGRFLENVVSIESDERDLLEDDTPADVISFGFRLSIQLSAEDLAKTGDGLKELVVLRNTLVHHFIERFDLWQAGGCAAASIYLQDCYSRIDGHYEELRAWAAHMETSRQYAASVMQSLEFQNLLFNGVAPDGTVDWNTARCTRLLREVEQRHAVEGWVPLSVAVAWLAQHHADQTPARYGCRRWVQVLNESRQFALRYLMEDGRRVPWFRSRAGQT